MADVKDTSDTIPMLDLRGEANELWDELSAAVTRVLRSGQYINGPEVRAFEQEVAAFLGVGNAVSVNSGTDALVIGLLAAGVEPGDEVITTPFTFFATVEAIVHVGATPVFVDIDPDSFNIDLAAISAAITPRTTAVVPVHLFGEPLAMAPLAHLAREYGLIVLEDCAQAFGARHRGDHGEREAGGPRVGSAGTVAAFSFYPTKALGAYGDGGLIVTQDAAIAERARSLRNHASDPHQRYVHRGIGFNSRLDEVQAGILRVKLPHVDAWNRRRREVAERYRSLLEDVQGVILPRATPGHVFHQYTVRVPPRSRVRLTGALAEAGIATSHFYPSVAEAWPANLGAAAARCPRAKLASTEALSLPIFPQLRLEQQERIARVMRTTLE